MSAKAAVVAVAGAAVAVAFLLGTALGWWGAGSSAPRGPLRVSTALSPDSTFYGDLVSATVSVSGDPKTLRASPAVEPSFAPYAPVAPVTVTRTTTGPRETIVYRYELQCVTDACLPVGKPLRIAFPPVTARTGGARATSAWPVLVVDSRLTAAQLASSKLPVRTAFVPAPAFGAPPGTLAALLSGAAAVLAIVAAAIVYFELAALYRSRHERRPKLGGLALAVAYARDAAARPDPADRRRAAEFLAEALRPGAPELADIAEEVAWSDAAPTPEQTLELVDAVELRELE